MEMYNNIIMYTPVIIRLFSPWLVFEFVSILWTKDIIALIARYNLHSATIVFKTICNSKLYEYIMTAIERYKF